MHHISLSYLKKIFEQKVLLMLRKLVPACSKQGKELISEENIKLILSWQHSGFHVYNETRIPAYSLQGQVSAGDIERIEKIASYMIRPPISLERLSYDDQKADVTYQGKRDIYNFHPLTFLAQLSLHIANHGEQACGERSESMVRYYGWYSNKKRGMRKKEEMLSKPLVLQEDLTD